MAPAPLRQWLHLQDFLIPASPPKANGFGGWLCGQVAEMLNESWWLCALTRTLGTQLACGPLSCSVPGGAFVRLGVGVVAPRPLLLYSCALAGMQSVASALQVNSAAALFKCLVAPGTGSLL